MKKKRLAAILGLFLIVAMYLATILFALIGSPFARSCLMASLFCTFLVPITIYAYLIVLRTFNRQQDPADTDET